MNIKESLDQVRRELLQICGNLKAGNISPGEARRGRKVSDEHTKAIRKAIHKERVNIPG